MPSCYNLDMKRTIYLARHGETEYNRLKKITGQLDVPLNDDGIEQAMMLSIELKDIYFDAIFCSPLKRCRQTVDERLKECDAGILEGESTSFMEEYSENFTPRGGESYFHLKKRLRDFIEDQVDSKNYENVLVISHGGPLKVIRSLFEDVKILSQEEMSIKNCNYWIIKTDAVCTIKSK